METKLRVRPLLVCDLSNIVIKPFSVGVTITSSICSNCSEQATRWSVDTSFLKRGAGDVTGARTVCRRKMSEAMPCKWAHFMCRCVHITIPGVHVVMVRAQAFPFITPTFSSALSQAKGEVWKSRQRPVFSSNLAFCLFLLTSSGGAALWLDRL